MTIALICPTRGRPVLLEKMKQSALDTSYIDESLVLAFSTNEDQINLYKKSRDSKDNIISFHENELIVTPDWSTVMSWNYLATLVYKCADDINLFMLAADDMIFATPGWDEALLNHYNALENKIHVYALRDSRDPNGTPHVIVTREYIDAMGYFLPPIFLHWFVDTWTVEIAKANNCFTHFKDYELIHDKPSDKGQADETHSRIRRMGWRERDVHVNATCQHFLEFEKQRLAKAMQ